jgi:hypothetical protein
VEESAAVTDIKMGVDNQAEDDEFVPRQAKFWVLLVHTQRFKADQRAKDKAPDADKKKAFPLV